VTALVLAISTASPALSLALFDGACLVGHDHREIGRGHAEALMPAIAALLDGQPAPVAVLVDIGPGSFTGIRIGIAAARALGLAWDVPVTGFSGAALVAARAFAERPGLARVSVVMDAGRGQLLFGHFDAGFGAVEIQTLAPAAVPAAGPLAGAGTALLAKAGMAVQPAGPDIVHAGHPDCAYALHLPPAARGLAPAAHYVRPPDAILPL